VGRSAGRRLADDPVDDCRRARAPATCG
jgi:hypothetical protein